VMRQWLTTPGTPVGAMASMVETAMEEIQTQARTDGDGIVRWKTANDKEEVRQFCLDLVERLEPVLRQLVLPYPHEIGKWFKVPISIPYLDGTPTVIYLRGEMDLLVQQAPGQYAVWDLKGTRDNSYWRKVMGQLVFYDLAALAMHRQPTARVGLIQPMCSQPVLEFVVNADQRRQMWAAIVQMAGDIWRRDTPCRTDTKHCSWCEVRHACPRYTDVGFGWSARDNVKGPVAA